MFKTFRFIFAVSTLIFLSLASSGGLLGQGRGEGRAAARARGTILVEFKPDATALERSQAHGREGAVVKFRSRHTRWEAVEIPPSADPQAVMADYRSDPAVEAVELMHPRELARVPNDLKKDQWGFHNDGHTLEVCAPPGVPPHPCGPNETGSTFTAVAGADIDAPDAWNLTVGSKKVVVAIVDSGVDTTRGDLSAHLVPGFDFLNNDPNPDDQLGHGTAVASIIGAVGNNDKGLTGLNWNVRIMPLKFCDGLGCGAQEELQAIEFAIDHGADVINMSFACDENRDPNQPNPALACGTGPFLDCFSQAELDELTAARDAGITLVAAAGNCAAVIDGNAPAYPCAYGLDGNICAGSTNIKDLASKFSNKGPGVVDIGAPGEEILAYSPSPPGGQIFVTGTSFSAPMTSGVAALMLARSTLTPGAVRDRIVMGGDHVGTLATLFEGGRLNAFNAVRDFFTRGRIYLNGPTGDVDLVADVNGDQRGDLIRGISGTGFRVNLAAPDRKHFLSAALWSHVIPTSVVLAGRVDGNMKEDLVLGDPNGFRVLRAGKGKFRAPEIWSNVPAGPQQVLGDVNGDHLADLIIADTSLHVLLSTGTSFGAPSTWAAVPGGTFIGSADFNGDGMDDFVQWTNATGTSDIKVLISTGTSFGPAIGWHIGNELEMVGTGDFDGDGMADVAGLDPNTGCVDVLLSTGTSFQAPREWTCRSNFDELLAGRIGQNRNLRADVLMHETGGAWRLMESKK